LDPKLRARRLFAATLAAAVCLSLVACLAPNRVPIPSFTRTPASGDAPLAVFFDASASIDPDGTIASYSWAFGDGASGDGVTTTHVYSDPGTFEAGLTVTDDRGTDASTVRAIDVSNPTNPPATGIDVGQVAPEFTLQSLAGSAVALADYRGHVILLDFWRSTCGPCRTTLPHLEALREKYAEDGLVVITVNLDTTEAAARAFIEENGFDDFVVLRGNLADAVAVRTLYDVDLIPYTFVIDRQGIVRHADHPIRLRDRHIEPWL
jgi:peroxiredoxin